MKKDEIEKLVSAEIASLNDSLASGYSERLKHVMTVMARFPQYSFNNCLLIFLQRPTATRVQGFHAWKKIGRSVKKGEKGIGITAPLAYRKQDATDDEHEIRGFRVVHVFDIEQTEGDELPCLAEPKGDAAAWIPRVERLIRSKGIHLAYGMIGCGAAGVSKLRSIVVLSGLRPAMQLQVLVHELAHELLHPDTETRRSMSHESKETEAEAVSQIVCQGLGIECREHSSDYILLHNGSAEVFSQSMSRVQQCSSEILLELFKDSATATSIEAEADPAKTESVLTLSA